MTKRLQICALLFAMLALGAVLVGFAPQQSNQNNFGGNSGVTTGLNGGITGTEGTCSNLTPAAGIDLFCPYSGSGIGGQSNHGWLMNNNNGGWASVPNLPDLTDSSGTSITSAVPIVGPIGAQTGPTYTFTGQTNSGMFYTAGVNISVGGLARTLWTTSNAQFNYPICDYATGLNCFDANSTAHLIKITGSTNLGFGTNKGQHFVTQAAGNDMAGTCTAAAATSCTVTFTTAYTSAPACTVTDQTNITTLKALPSTTNLVITTASSSSDVFSYICVGNPN